MRAAQRNGHTTVARSRPGAVVAGVVVALAVTGACADPKGLADVDGTRPVPSATALPSTTVDASRRVDAVPAPVGRAVAIGDGWTMTVTGFVADADDAVAAENPFNDEAPSGRRYVLVTVTLAYGEGAAADKATPSVVRLDAVGRSGTTYRSSDAPVVAPGELPRATDVFRGGTVTGTVAFAVDVADATDLVIAASAGVDTDERFFATVGDPVAPAATTTTSVASATSAATAAAAPFGSRADPVPLGRPADIGDGWQLRVDGYTRDADEAVAAANQFNVPPPSGRHYVLVRVTLTYSAGADDEKANPLAIMRVVGPSNVSVSWTDVVVVAPDALNVTADVFRGGSLSGNLAFAVTDDDAARLLFYASAGFGNDDVFFATGPTR